MSISASAITNWSAMPGAMLTDNYADLLNASFKEIIRNEWSEGINGLDFYRVVNSDRNYEKFSAVTGTTLIPISSDEEDIPQDQPIQGYDWTVTPKTFRRKITITKQMREDNLFSDVISNQQDLAESAKLTIEYWAAKSFNAGFGTSGDFLCSDGMYLFDSGRYREDSGQASWSNLETGALSGTSLATARVNAMKVTDGRGLIRGVNLETLLVPPDLAQKAFELNASDLRPEDAQNAKNWNKNVLNVRVWNKLTSATAWFVLGTVNRNYGLTWVWRVKPTPSSYNDGSNDDLFVQKIRFRFGQGAGIPYGLRGSTGA